MLQADHSPRHVGRRMPYIVGAAPIAVIAFALIPIAPMLIPAELSGNISELTVPFVLLMGAAGVMLLAMAILRTPVIALMPDLIPSDVPHPGHLFLVRGLQCHRDVL